LCHLECGLAPIVAAILPRPPFVGRAPEARSTNRGRDVTVYAAVGFVSGHTVKHLLAASGIAVLLMMLRRRAVLATTRLTH
jgi:threonine/homoserine/homoserine lactone efflux protein